MRSHGEQLRLDAIYMPGLMCSQGKDRRAEDAVSSSCKTLIKHEMKSSSGLGNVVCVCAFPLLVGFNFLLFVSVLKKIEAIYLRRKMIKSQH